MLIFVSYSSLDKVFARRLSQELHTRKLRIWLDEAEIRVGESIPAKVATALNEAEVLCLVISAQSARSSWVHRELNVFTPRWISGAAALIPCRLDNSAMPGLLTDVKYADFSVSFEDGLAQLVGGVKIREELTAQRELESARQELLRKLRPPDVAFLVHHFSRKDYYIVGDRRHEGYPSALRTFASIGGLEVIEDKYDIDFSLTPKGKRLIEVLANDAPRELLEKWDQSIGPRRSR